MLSTAVKERIYINRLRRFHCRNKEFRDHYRLTREIFITSWWRTNLRPIPFGIGMQGCPLSATPVTIAMVEQRIVH